MQDLQALDWSDVFSLLHDWAPGRGSQPAAIERHSQAWAELHRRVQALARQALSGAPVSPSDVDDVAQMAVLKFQSTTVWRKLRTARSIAGYVRVVVQNQAKDLLRRRASERLALEKLASVSPEETERSIRENTASIERLRMLLELLSVEERQLVRWRFYENLTLREISQILQVPISTIAQRIVRIQNKLRRNL